MNKNNIGKWKYDKDEGDWLVMDDGFSIIAIVQEESDVDPEKAARLISSAPELLAELEMLSNIVEGCGLGTMPEVECRIAFARAAIAKATGESA